MSDIPDFHSNKEPFEVVFSPWREDLAKRIIKRLHEKGVQVSYSKMKYNTFASGEILPDVPQSVRGKDVYFLHDLQAEDPNIALMRYLLSADALTRSDVASIICVFPNIPYLRQDRREPDERASISAAVVLRLIEESSLSIAPAEFPRERAWILPIDDMLAAAMHQTMQVAGSVSQLVR